MAKHANLIGFALGNAVGNFVNNSAKSAIQGVMGANANAASAAGQAAAMGFNQGSTDLANSIDSGRINAQYGFNSAMMANANDYNTMMWNQAANWNEAMWEKQANFNAEQASLQREWAERMENTKYQRAIKDMSAAGLNPILAVTGGGISSGAGSGMAASVGGAQMSSASAQMASGGLLGADSASVGGYQGQAEFQAGILALLAQAFNGMASAQNAMSGLGEFGEGLGKSLSYLFDENTKTGKVLNDVQKTWQKGKTYQSDSSYKPNYRNGIDWNMKNPNW